MSTQNPTHVGSDPRTDPPESFAEILMGLEHRAGAAPAEMLASVDAAAGRIDDALAAVDLSDLSFSRVSVDVFTRLNAESAVPLYPVQMGDRVLTCHADVVEAVEQACNATELREYAHDLAGREYEVQVDVRLTPRR